MLIKTGYPNLLHGCEFLCSDLMNYSQFENVNWQSQEEMVVILFVFGRLPW